jgi:hypothetical protein
MDEPGDRRPVGTIIPAREASASGGRRRRRSLPSSLTTATLLALAIALLTALTWALLRGILELGPGLLALAAIAGWGIGKLIGEAQGRALLAVGIATLAWVLGLMGTWLVSMAILPGSSRTFLERLEATPFLEWMSPQLGVLEVAGLILLMASAAYGARRPPARQAGVSPTNGMPS